MPISRRRFVQTSALAATAAYAAPISAQRGAPPAVSTPVPEAIRALEALSRQGRAHHRDKSGWARIDKARKLMADNDIGAIVLETGTSMSYFANVRWGLSERPFLLVIPQKGELAYVCPGFEEERAREITTFTKDVRVWQEDEDWGPTVARHPEGSRRAPRRRSASRSACASSSPTASRKAAPASKVVLATPVTAGCRMYQVASRDRADAARQRHHDRGVSGGVGDAARRHDAGRARAQHPRRVRRARRARRVSAHRLRQVLRLPARQHHAASHPRRATSS